MSKFKVLFTILCSFFLSIGLANAEMQISSPDFNNNQIIKLANVFNGFGCEGENISPQINVKNIPLEAKSLAITIYDPDAPTGSGWWHLVAYDINVDHHDLVIPSNFFSKKNSKNIKFGRNDYGNFNYGGPCPPVGHGKHNYILSVYALGIDKLNVPKSATSALIGYNINSNTIEKAVITSIYQR